MPNYHFEAKIISRGKGNSFARTANYISGVSLHDSYLNQTYYRKREDVLHTAIILPPRAPPEFHSLQTLCDKINAAERRCDAQTAREFIGSLPNELPPGELIQIATDFASSNFVENGLGVIMGIHKGENKSDPFKNNPHVHILVTTRTMGPEGFSLKKDREHNKREYINIWREQWALAQNRAYERNGLDIRVSHESLISQGEYELEATIRLSHADWQREKSGVRTRAGERYREVQERNRQRLFERELLLERVPCMELSR